MTSMSASGSFDVDVRVDGRWTVTFAVDWVGEPDLSTIDALGRAVLSARRHGCDVRVRVDDGPGRRLVERSGLAALLATNAGVAERARTVRRLVVNLAVSDLERSVAFFRSLGFEFDARFADHRSRCLVLSPEAWVLLMHRERFTDYTDREICDTTSHTEALLAIACERREDVDELVRLALANGGRPAMDRIVHPYVYGWSFYDPDGHHWEVLWTDPG